MVIKAKKSKKIQLVGNKKSGFKIATNIKNKGVTQKLIDKGDAKIIKKGNKYFLVI